jgi:hypothetical protein
VNPLLVQYLGAVGFDVLFAPKVKVDYRDDTAIVKWARQHNRIVVTHDRYKDRTTKIRICEEIYQNGGQVIQISGGPSQTPLISLGKLLTYHEDWVNFFKENDGMVLVHKIGIKCMPRAYLLRQILRTDISSHIISTIPSKSPRRQGRVGRKPKPTPLEQFPLLPSS